MKTNYVLARTSEVLNTWYWGILDKILQLNSFQSSPHIRILELIERVQVELKIKHLDMSVLKKVDPGGPPPPHLDTARE